MSRLRSDAPVPEEGVRVRPALEQWAELARSNAEWFREWRFSVGGVPFDVARHEARAAASVVAREYTARLGIGAAEGVDGPVIMTGHQPEFFHPGVWVKHFLMQRVVRETGGTGIDIVVDTDAFESLGVTVPCRGPEVHRCRQELLSGDPRAYYAAAPVPDRRRTRAFCDATRAALATLAMPEATRNLDAFCDALGRAHPPSASVAELITGARRRYEGAWTEYAELPVSALAATLPWRRFAVDIVLEADRFARIHNTELASYRERHRVRSAAQPLPDLRIGESRVELPFWLLGESKRYPVFAHATERGVELWAREEVVAAVPYDAALAAEALGEAGIVLAPRAVTLTMFLRSHVADLFIHGTGGERYEQVTERIVESWWGVRLPPMVVATLSMRLAADVSAVDDDAVAAVARRLHRLTHNPDTALAEMEFASVDEEQRALRLADEKGALVRRLRESGADRAALGARLARVNEELRMLVAPLLETVRRERDLLERLRSDAEVLSDRTYPFFLWSPEEMAEVVR